MSAGALVVGEALIDEVVEADRFRRHPGGSPANVALGLARLGVPTRLHTTLGSDANGDLIRQHLHASGVALTSESTTDSPTSTAVATLADDGSATYRFAVTWDPRTLDDLGEPEVVHCGSLGVFLEPGADVTRDLIRRGRAVGAFITFDPNIRPSLIPEQNEARRRFTDTASSSHLTKLSEEDAEYLFPGSSPDQVLDALVDSGVIVAAITLGSRGAYLASGHVRVAVPPVKTSVADTVGAGDSFMAAMVWALVFDGAGWDGAAVSVDRLEDIAAKAATAAAITVSRPGADLPSLGDLTTFQPAA